MQDDQLLQDLERDIRDSPWQGKSEYLEALRTHGIATYSKLFHTLCDQTASTDIRAKAAWVAIFLRKIVDKRRAIPPLLLALKSSENEVRNAAVNALGYLHSRVAVPELINIAANKIESDMLRTYAILALASIDDKRAVPVLRQIMFDETDSVHVRADAIERMTYFRDGDALDDYITLLSHESSDIRFWSAYAIISSHGDISKALPILDEIVAFDHRHPVYWGWHVDREAIPALERIYNLPYRIPSDDAYITFESSYLISPAAEYWTYSQTYRPCVEWGKYTTLPTPPVTLNIDPEWLANKLRERWPDVVLNDRQPRPKSYLLDWRLQIDGKYLIGGLHRDRYAVVLTAYPGCEDIIHLFAAWYRSIIPPEEPLFLYDWAEEGVAL